MDRLNLYTKPEQSKKLIKLGLPAETADLLYHESTTLMLEKRIALSTIDGYKDYQSAVADYKRYYDPETIIPCWSLGRLVEVVLNTPGFPFFGEPAITITKSNISNIFEQIIYVIENNQDVVDISKVKI